MLEPFSRRLAGRLILGTVVLALLASGAWLGWQRRQAESSPADKVDVDAVASKPSGHRPVKPSPRSTGDYVGSEICAKCHAAIAKKYSEHPMGRSASVVSNGDDLESYGPQTLFKPGDGRQYWVERQGDAAIHHEAMVDEQGEIYDQAVPVHYAIGSGTKGRSYIIDRGGELFMSPLSWYCEGARWDLSPSYAPESHQRFERRIAAECLLCHTGRLRQRPGQQDTFESDPFIEISIGCERCHGPGREHVALQQSSTPPKPDHSIVNPSALEPALRDSVCNQCHLQGVYRVPRYGRTYSDFRPGELLASCWSTFVEGTGVRDDGATKFVSQAQQMVDSACFKGSSGKMGCISCHDPHAKPTASEQQAYYRQRCLSCHADRGCSLASERREAPPANGSCVHCHMPPLGSHDVAHASQTDHRVRRRSEVSADGSAQGEGSDGFSFFGEDEESLEPWEVRRALGIVTLQLASVSPPDAFKLREAEAMLKDMAELAEDDVLSLETLGIYYLLRQNHREARRYLERLLELDPNHEAALSCMSRACYEQKDYRTGLQYMTRLLKINPWIADDRLRHADMLGQTGQFTAAIQEGLKSLELNPSQKVLRAWLIQAYLHAGDEEAARREEAILRRMEELRP